MPTRSTLRLKAMSAEEQLRDTNLRRIRGELSCAECRRLKLRCDKKSPCSSCVRRGCESICPCGAFEPWTGSRYIVASSTQLHTKISAMSSRIRSLEDGLAILQSSISDERHPLLEEHLLKIKFDIEITNHDESSSGSNKAENRGSSSGENADSQVAIDVSSLNALGTLTIGEDGEASYFGRSAGGETLILTGDYLSGDDSDSSESDFEDVAEDVGMSSMTVTKRFSRSAKLDDEQGVGGSGANQTTTSVQTSCSPPSAEVQMKDPYKLHAIPPELYVLADGGGGMTSSCSGTEVADLLRYLPTPSRAESLVNAYFNHAALFFRPMKKTEVFTVVLPRVYSQYICVEGEGKSSIASCATTNESQGSITTTTTGDSKFESMLPSPHLLASVFFIFALGAYYDVSLPAPSYASEAESWYHLGRKALLASPSPAHLHSDDPVLTRTSNQDSKPIREPGSTLTSLPHETAQALGLMGTYFSAVGEKRSRESAWCSVGLAVKIAQGAGLHRDPARWGMDPQAVQKRRTLWWELAFADARDSTALGRPPSTHLAFVDCEFPTDEEASLDSSGEVMMGPWRMKHACTKELFASIIETTLTANSPSYDTILDVDRKIRQFKIPPYFKSTANPDDDGDDPNYHDSSMSLRDFWGTQLMNFMMLYLHRSFFVHAVSTCPSNPLASPFAPSFLATYRAANELIKAAMNFSNRCDKVAGRSWFLLYHVFSAAVAVGTVAHNSPGSNIAASALMDLSMAVDFFEKCAGESYRNKVALLVLRKLKDKGLRSYTKFLASRGSISDKTLDSNLFTKRYEEDADELALFGGQAKLVQAKGNKSKPKHKRKMSRNRRSISPPQESPTSSGSPTASASASASASVSPRTSMSSDDANYDLLTPGGSHFNILAQMTNGEAGELAVGVESQSPPYSSCNGEMFPMDVIVDVDLQDAFAFGDTAMGSRIEKLTPVVHDIGLSEEPSRQSRSMEGIHPSLVEYLSGIESRTTSHDWDSDTPISNFPVTTATMTGRDSWPNTTALPLPLPNPTSTSNFPKRPEYSPPSLSPLLPRSTFSFQPSVDQLPPISLLMGQRRGFSGSSRSAAQEDHPENFYEWFMRGERI